MNDCAMRNVF